jgi:uncharacterized membrane protein YdcZ (DUF606 family)
MKLQRWNDWVLLVAIISFIVAPIGSLIILLGIEQPIYDELNTTYNQSTSRPGHYMEGAVVGMARIVFTIISIIAGLVLAIAGSIRIPKLARTTLNLRQAAWISFPISLIACFVTHIV